MAKWLRPNFEDHDKNPFDEEETSQTEPNEFERLLASDKQVPPARHKSTLSRKSSQSQGVNSLYESYENQTPVEAKVTKAINGGFEAFLGSKRCFVPLSQIDMAKVTDPEIYVGQSYSFLIVELKNNNIVLSRKALLRDEFEKKIAKAKESLAEGQTHQATVTRIAPFGAFAAIDGVEGLIHINELSGKRVKKVEDVVNVGDVVTAKIIKIEHSPQFRMSLSLNDAVESVSDEHKKYANQQNAPSQEPQSNAFAAAFDKANKRKK